jgi:Domain of unknown function (DUF4145)
MRCPHCSIAISPVFNTGPMGHGAAAMFYRGADSENHRVAAASCPECKEVFLLHTDLSFEDGPERGTATSKESREFLLWPRVSSRAPVPADVPEEYASLAREAGLILTDSPRASAALSRRCLQQLLRNKAGAPPSDLYHEIEWAIQNAGLPTHASECLHDLREIGNMAAHQNKSTATGDYVEVEPGEAEWTLETLDALFDHYFVGPARTAARKAALAAKLGKTP